MAFLPGIPGSGSADLCLSHWVAFHFTSSASPQALASHAASPGWQPKASHRDRDGGRFTVQPREDAGLQESWAAAPASEAPACLPFQTVVTMQVPMDSGED